MLGFYLYKYIRLFFVFASDLGCFFADNNAINISGIYRETKCIMIPYENYQLTEKQIERIKGENAQKAIREYIKKHGTEPDDISSFFTISQKDIDRYKRVYYAQKYENEFKEEQTGEKVDVALNFTPIEDSVRLSANATRGEETYQYEYWTIAVAIYNDYGVGYWNSSKIDGYLIGCFTSLDDVTVRLNTFKKYGICMYHRKSNYAYERITSQLPLDNAFHNFPQYPSNMCLSDYGIYTGAKVNTFVPYETQSEDKEYIGVIEEYYPQKGGTINGQLYSYNPRTIVNVSGFTDRSR